jgi:hypothetical protein
MCNVARGETITLNSDYSDTIALMSVLHKAFGTEMSSSLVSGDPMRCRWSAAGDERQVGSSWANSSSSTLIRSCML